jgi:hypothetical protein
MTAQHNGHTLTIETSTNASGARIFIGDLLGKSGKPCAGYVCGNVADDGTLSNVRHVNGRNVRSL